MRLKKKVLEGLIFKVDFEKAYDIVDWYFLDWIMAKMRFERDREMDFSMRFHSICIGAC